MHLPDSIKFQFKAIKTFYTNTLQKGKTKLKCIFLTPFFVKYKLNSKVLNNLGHLPCQVNVS